MAKGNRSNSKRNTTAIQGYNDKFKQEIDGYKQFAEARRKNRVFTQEQVTVFHEGIKKYFEEKSSDDEPFTISGILLELNLNETIFYRMKNGEYDYRLYEYIDINGIDEADIMYDNENLPYVMSGEKKVLLIPFSEIVEKAYLRLQEQIEERLYEKGRVGDIFALKSKHGWNDSGDTPHTVNQTLVIATEEQARRAIECLEGNRVKLS